MAKDLLTMTRASVTLERGERRLTWSQTHAGNYTKKRERKRGTERALGQERVYYTWNLRFTTVEPIGVVELRGRERERVGEELAGRQLLRSHEQRQEPSDQHHGRVQLQPHCAGSHRCCKKPKNSLRTLNKRTSYLKGKRGTYTFQGPQYQVAWSSLRVFLK